MGQRLDITGRRYGRLTAIEPTKVKRGSWEWKLECDCGNTHYATVSQLTRGNTNSCGCFRKEFRKLLSNGSAKNRLFNNYKSSAKKRNISFNLDIEEFLHLTQNSCYYCGIEPSQITKSRDSEYAYNGIDRVDNSKDYTLDNCVACCSVCNYAKRDMDVEQFRNWIKRLYINMYRKSTNLTPGQLTDLLITTSMKCWWQQEKIMDESLSDSERKEAAIKAQEYNAKRTKLIRTIDMVLDFTEDTNTDKTYDREDHTYFEKGTKK